LVENDHCQAVLSRWVEVDSVITICALREPSAAKTDSMSVADCEKLINCIVRLKQALLIVNPALQELEAGQNQLFKDIAEVIILVVFCCRCCCLSSLAACAGYRCKSLTSPSSHV
jgi:hypothetical protein